ncbi:MAG TPA: hypothetical protein VHT50_30560, partial [Mycobacterium sp.]|nr:hypothetical protein [Mycobacterium sp.]
GCDLAVRVSGRRLESPVGCAPTVTKCLSSANVPVLLGGITLWPRSHVPRSAESDESYSRSQAAVMTCLSALSTLHRRLPAMPV